MNGNCNCSVPEVVNIPGLAGPDGQAGTNGINAVAITTSAITLPGSAGPVIGATSVSSSLGFAINQIVFISLDSSHNATFTITSILSASTIQLSWLAYPNDASAGGTTIDVGAAVVPAGVLATIANPLPITNGGTGQITAPLALAALITAGNVGTFVANGVTPVTVVNANVTANSVVICCLQTVGGTVGAVPAVKTITPTTGFTVVATAADTSTYNYIILN
jgi:hypothetical protein